MAGLLQDGLISLAKGKLHGDTKDLVPDWTTPPSTAESLIPVWGSAREAIADYNARNYVGFALNSALAISDLSLLSSVGRNIIKVGIKQGSNTWDATRKWMQKNGHIKPNEQGHHWALSQNEGFFSNYFPSMSKIIPNKYINQWYNVMSLPRDIHMRLHGNWNGMSEFSAAEKYWHGTPFWAKSAVNSYGGRIVEPLIPGYPENSNQVNYGILGNYLDTLSPPISGTQPFAPTVTNSK